MERLCRDTNDINPTTLVSMVSITYAAVHDR